MFANFTTKKKWIVASVALALLALGAAQYHYWIELAGSRNVLFYEKVVTGRKHSPEDMRGLVDNLMKFRKDLVPAFLPQYLWGEEYCAATVITAVNFITGKRTLAEAAAWKFSRVNTDRVTQVYSRPADDFEWKTLDDGTHQLQERFDRPIWLSRVLPLVNGTTDRLYVVGYHYSQTRNDEKLWDAHADLNTHMMLLLGRYDGSWYGYHMLHDRIGDVTYPFRIETLSDNMTKWFDIMYIWEVHDTQLAVEGSPKAFVQELSSYARVKRVLSLPGFKKVNVLLWGDYDQFPRIENGPSGVYDVAYGREEYRIGELLGFVDSVPIRFHVGSSNGKRSAYGLVGQCVEFANRYLAEVQDFKNLVRTGDADSYFYRASEKGLQPYANGGVEKPAVGDLMVFDPDAFGGNPGHVAVVTTIDEYGVWIAQQNVRPWHVNLTLTSDANGHWSVGTFTPELPCVGWSRIPTEAPAPDSAKAPPNGSTTAKDATRLIKIQTVKRGLRHTVRAVVARTPGADLRASFACNGWDFGKEARHKIYPGQTWNVCAWASEVSRNN